MSADHSRCLGVDDDRRHHATYRYATVWLAGLAAIGLLASSKLLRTPDWKVSSTTSADVVVVDTSRKALIPELAQMPMQPPSPPIRAALPLNLNVRISEALGGGQVELYDLQRSEQRDDAYCGSIATASQPERRRFVLLEQPFLIAIDDGDLGFADLNHLCSA